MSGVEGQRARRYALCGTDQLTVLRRPFDIGDNHIAPDPLEARAISLGGSTSSAGSGRASRSSASRMARRPVIVKPLPTAPTYRSCPSSRPASTSDPKESLLVLLPSSHPTTAKDSTFRSGTFNQALARRPG